MGENNYKSLAELAEERYTMAAARATTYLFRCMENHFIKNAPRSLRENVKCMGASAYRRRIH